MEIKNNFHIHLERCSKFYRYLVIQGTCSLPGNLIKNLQIVGGEAIYTDANYSTSKDGNCKFNLHVLRSCNKNISTQCEIVITTIEDHFYREPLKPLLDSIHGASESEKLRQRFGNLLMERSITKMLDLGGRDRSGLDRSKLYPDQDVTVLDVHQGKNVDIVGDAHELREILPAQSFGAVLSVAVFEHLAMPWKVALGINHCLESNGLAFIVTHQTIGMHDMPWDFWRYSDSAWNSLFNQRTGFRILGKALSEPVHIIPFYYLEAMADAERAAGFLMSSVLVEKTHTVKDMNWPATMTDLGDSQYPTE